MRFLVNSNKRKKKKKQVKFRLGTDGNEWCWVIGESETCSNNIGEQNQINEQSNHR
jgi:hypothetical protein